MRGLLIDPPGTTKGFNSGRGYLAAVLRDHFPLTVLDLNNIVQGACGDPNPELAPDELAKRLVDAAEEFRPDLVGVSVKTYTVGVCQKIFELIRAASPKVITLAGGPHITLDGLRFMSENAIDYGIVGEGEWAVPELLNSLAAGHRGDGVPGALCLRNDRVVENPPRRAIENLDGLPFPDFSDFSSVIANEGRLSEYPLLTSRGCPYECTFCSMPRLMGRRWRGRSPARVVGELKKAKRRYKCTSFAAVDDNLTLDRKRAEEIFDLIAAEEIDLPWRSQNGIRADHITAEFAAKMKRSGCRHVWIGIESADERVFGLMKKGESLESIETGIRALKGAGIRVGGFFVTGLPESSREADLAAVGFVKKNKIDGWWFNFIPYPHTEAWDWVRAHGRNVLPIEGSLQYGSDAIEPAFETEDYSREARLKTYR